MLALFITLLSAIVFAPSVSVDATEEETYWCYGDSITLEYDGEATDVDWELLSTQGKLLGSGNDKIFNFNASGYDELLVTQKVTTDQGSTVKSVRIHPLHHNELSISVNFINDSTIYDKRVIDSTTVCKNRAFIDLPENPTKDGGKFGGWVYENGESFTVTEPITQDMDLFAKWLRSCSIVLMSDNEVYTNLTAYEGDTISLPPLESKDGKEFLLWSTDRHSVSEFNQEEAITGDLVLYAVWSEAPGKAAHNDTTSLMLAIPVIAIIAILLFSRIHRNKVRIVPGSSKGRFGGK